MTYINPLENGYTKIYVPARNLENAQLKVPKELRDAYMGIYVSNAAVEAMCHSSKYEAITAEEFKRMRYDDEDDFIGLTD